ncbi:MAG TPA: protease complex subunit PrcB family protein [Gaiellaceae bacterium]|nr:protease complex subunit PrcB family protein [Gaiellaceae bacterium]
MAAGAWLAYAHWWGRGDAHAYPYRDVTQQLGRVEFTRKVRGVYHSRAALQGLLDATMPGRAPRVPPIDFSRDEVVVVSLGPRSSSGYSLRVVRLVERRRGLYLTLREQTPKLGDPVDPHVTYPYRALAIRRSAKPVYVKLQGR